LVAAPLICLANLVIVRRPAVGLGAYLLLGSLFGIVGQISYLALPGLVLTTLGLVVPATLAGFLRKAAAIGAGFWLATLLIWAPQIIAGTWLAYIQEQIYFYHHYRAQAQSFEQLVNGFLAPALYIGLPVLAVAIPNAVKRPRNLSLTSFLPIALQLIGTLISACTSNRYYPHYLILCLPSLSALTAMSLSGVSTKRERIGNVVLLYFAGIAAFLSMRGLPDRISHPGLEKQAARLVDQLVGPGRRVFVFNESPAIYYLSNSDVVGPYIVPNLYLRTCSTTVEMPLTDGYLVQILRARPDLIISGSVCANELDADGLFKRWGYGLVGSVSEGGRRIDAYAPSGLSAAALQPLPARPIRSPMPRALKRRKLR
jgi:hypothetical protein